MSDDILDRIAMIAWQSLQMIDPKVNREEMPGAIREAIRTALNDSDLITALRAAEAREAQQFREGFSRGFEAAWVKVTSDQGKAPFFLSDAEIEHAWEIFNDIARRALGGEE